LVRPTSRKRVGKRQLVFNTYWKFVPNCRLVLELHIPIITADVAARVRKVQTQPRSVKAVGCRVGLKQTMLIDPDKTAFCWSLAP